MRECYLRTYKDDFKDEMISVWEESVRSTHTFLKEEDVLFYKSIVEIIDFNKLLVFCYFNDDNQLIGFLGVEDQKLEMMFLKPEYIGMGVGKRLMNFALIELGISEVDVNEDNLFACTFYKRFGFKVKDRKPTDSCGKPYPVLTMEINMPSEV